MAESGRELERAGGEGRRLARWDPFADLDLFEGWSPLREWGFLPRMRRLLEEGPGSFAPAVDVDESEGQYTITAEVPGVSRDDVTVEVEEGVLHIRGEKRSEREEKKGRRRWTERSYGAFTRSFGLPADADPDRIEASFKDGVLTVTVPRTGERKPRVVSIRG